MPHGTGQRDPVVYEPGTASAPPGSSLARVAWRAFVYGVYRAVLARC